MAWMSTVTVPQLMQKSVEKWRVLGVAILVALSLVGGVFNQDAFVLRLFEGSLPIPTLPVHTELIDSLLIEHIRIAWYWTGYFVTIRSDG